MSNARKLIRQGWEEVAENYSKDRLGIFERYARRLLDLLQPPSESKLLDIGTGTGAVAFQAAALVGPAGHVTGVDIAQAMVSLAEQTAVEQDVTNITFRWMDAEQLDFPDASFDSVTCAFSLFQFPDMEQALVEMRRVLKPGGRLGFSNWGPGYFSPVASLQRNLFREFGLRPLLSNPIVFKPNRLQELLLGACFTAVDLIEETDEIWFEKPEQVWAFNMDMGPFQVMLQSQLSTDQRRKLVEQFTTMLEALVTERGIKCTFHPLYALAR